MPLCRTNASPCRMLSEKGAPKFTCMVVDEHHDQLGCPTDRKRSWRQLANFAGLSNMPVILLSATAPPTLLKKFLDIYSMHKDRTALIRGTTNRPEIGLHAIHLALSPKTGLANLVSALVKKLTGEERMLVFFTSCEAASAFSTANKCAVYHSKLPSSGNTKSYNLERWAAGHKKAMACTSAFASGVDYPSVRFVVIFDPSYSFLTTMQMVGRAGRDGRESHAFFVTSKRPGSFINPSDALLVLELEHMVYGDKCRVYQAMKTMDGAHLAKKCRELEGQVLCDVCNPNGEMHRFAAAAVHISSPPKARLATERNGGSASGSNWTTAGEMMQREKGKERANAVKPQQRSQSTDYGLGVPLPPVFYKAADVVENHEPLAMVRTTLACPRV
jgi:superfamily II DNA helicase RecQ